MGWLRENWFDLLLLVVLAAVVVAIVLFLTGINPFARQPAVVSGTPQSEVQAPVEAPVPPAGETPPETQGPPGTAQPAEAEKPGVSVLPLPPAVETPSAEPAQPTKVQVPAAAKPTQPAAPEKPAVESAPKALYRVSIGAFAKPEFAVDLAAKARAQGYPVRIEVIGRISRVVVGPYSSRAEAESVAKAFSSYQPQIYRGDTPLPKGIYLQVGAFRKLEGARDLAKSLKDKGFDVVVYYRDAWARVWVGPLAPEQVREVKTELQALDLTPMEVKGGEDQGS